MTCQSIFLILTFVSVTTFATRDTFKEELFIKPLSSGHTYFHFQFVTTWDAQLGNSSSFLHYHLFPKSLGEVLNKFHILELHLSQTQGFWQNSKWGYPVSSAPPGAELWVWFQEGTQNVDSLWTDLVNVLSGMFCSSLNFMDSKITIIPRMSFRPQGVTPPHHSNRQHGNLVRYSALPREIVCTENLTPWKKLLPFESRVGLATLFDSVKLHNADFHSLGIHVRPVCEADDCLSGAVELSQTLSVVFDTAGTSVGSKPQGWSFRKLFGRILSSQSPLADNTKIFVDLSKNTSSSLDHSFSLSPEPTSTETFVRGGIANTFAVYDVNKYLRDNRALDLTAKYDKPSQGRRGFRPSHFHVGRFQTGYGQEKGGVTTLVYNDHEGSSDQTVLYQDVLPWFLRVYIHTLKVQTFLGAGSMQVGENGTIVVPRYLHYRPGKDRQSAYHLEVVFSVPANSVASLSFEFDRALLKWTEYPPDANHGFYVGSAVLSTLLTSPIEYTSPPQRSALIEGLVNNDSSSSYFLRLHTEVLLVTLPTPDFSMPYNVICLTCTVVAIAFGSIHNLTTRAFVLRDPAKQQSLLAKIKQLLKRKKGEDVVMDAQIVKEEKEEE